MATDSQEHGPSPAGSEDRSEHWDIICLGVVTIATAAIGAAVLGSDLEDVVTSSARYSLAIIALLTYLNVLSCSFMAIFSAVGTSQTQPSRWATFLMVLYAITGPKKNRVAMVFVWFMLEMIFLVGLLGVVEAFESLLQSTCS